MRRIVRRRQCGGTRRRKGTAKGSRRSRRTARPAGSWRRSPDAADIKDTGPRWRVWAWNRGAGTPSRRAGTRWFAGTPGQPSARGCSRMRESRSKSSGRAKGDTTVPVRRRRAGPWRCGRCRGGPSGRGAPRPARASPVRHRLLRGRGRRTALSHDPQGRRRHGLFAGHGDAGQGAQHRWRGRLHRQGQGERDSGAGGDPRRRRPAGRRPRRGRRPGRQAMQHGDRAGRVQARARRANARSHSRLAARMRLRWRGVHGAFKQG